MYSTFFQAITRRGVMNKDSKSFINFSESSDVNGASPITQSMDSNMISSNNTSLNATRPPTRTIKANMPQPSPSTFQILTPLTVPSCADEHVNPTSESRDDYTENQQRLISQNTENMNAVVLNNENDYPVDPPPLKRQTARRK